MDTDYLYGIERPDGVIVKKYNQSLKKWEENELWIKYKDVLKNWFNKILKSGAIRSFIYPDPFSENKNITKVEKEIDIIFKYIIQCTFELLDMLLETTNGIIGKKSIQTVSCSCFIVAFKLIGAYDWISDSEHLYEVMADLSDKSVIQSISDDKFCEMAKKYNRDSKKIESNILKSLEIDILERTDWKGCPTARISKEEIELNDSYGTPILKKSETPKVGTPKVKRKSTRRSRTPKVKRKSTRRSRK